MYLLNVSKFCIEYIPNIYLYNIFSFGCDAPIPQGSSTPDWLVAKL